MKKLEKKLMHFTVDEFRVLLKQLFIDFTYPYKNKKSIDNNMVTTRELYEIFDITKPTMYKWIDAKFIHPIKIGGKIYFDRESVNKIKKEGIKYK